MSNQPITKATSVSVGLIGSVGTFVVGGVLWMNSVDANVKYLAKDHNEHKQNFKEHQVEVQHDINELKKQVTEIREIVIRIDEKLKKGQK